MVADRGADGARHAPNVKYRGEHEIDFSRPGARPAARGASIEYAGLDYRRTTADTERLRDRGCSNAEAASPRPGWGTHASTSCSATFVEPKLIQPTFLTDYPLELSPLAKGKPDDPRDVERFEAFVAGIEMANAFSELNDPRDQRERFLEQVGLREAGDDEAQPLDEDFLERLEHGMPPTAVSAWASTGW